MNTQICFTHLLIFPQEVSKVPMSLNTASKMSLITSGGILSALISDSVSVLMFPTASLASLTSGSMVDSSISIAFFLFSSLPLSSDCCCLTFSTSVFCSLACYIRIHTCARIHTLITVVCMLLNVCIYIACDGILPAFSR